MTKVTIISGFLGAGKTTFIKKLIEEIYKGQKVVLIENEFGEIGIDGGFLKDAGVQINEMNSGCICCSLVGDFGKALKQVSHDYAPDMIIIEPSGVGKLSDVIAAVENVKEEADLELENFITVADATKCKLYMKNFGEFYNNQLESATTVVLSRTQNVDEAKLETAVNLIKEHNDKASSASASSFVIYLPITLVGLLNARSKGSTLTCVIIVDTVLYMPLLRSSVLMAF
jgi:G3E family GTPase